MTTASFERVLTFWLGELDDDGCASAETSKRWWTKDAAFDRAVRAQFAADHAAISRGERAEWLATARGRLAYIIVLDQLSRNMFRDTARMYEQDHRAVMAALVGIANGHLGELGFHECYFMYMPLMHAEDRDVQAACVVRFRAMVERFHGQAERINEAVGFADRHKAIVDRFGRFPHRNTIVGRASTAEEAAFLAQPGSSF